jgi:O-antigen ligase
MWIPALPVIAVASFEAMLGLVQFAMMRAAGGDVASATGTYVNRNHFAGLLEMAFPLALAGAFAAWNRRGVWRSAAILAVAGCLLAGVVVSLSRMGFAATLAGAIVVTPVLLWPKGFRWSLLVPVAAALALALLLPTKELKQRFAYMAANEEVNTDTRVEIWRNTLPLIAAHPWTGTGLGAYERGLYPFKTTRPTNTVDYAHSDYLQILAELGVFGALLAAALGVWILRNPIRIALGHPLAPNRGLAAGLLGALLAIGIHSLADFNLYIPANAMALAWIAGLAVSPGLEEMGARGGSARSVEVVTLGDRAVPAVHSGRVR